MYFGPITGAVAYKWVGELIRGGGGGLRSGRAYMWGMGGGLISSSFRSLV